MSENRSDTIIALASGSLPAGVAILRISGRGAGSLLEALTGQQLPAARTMVLRTVRDPRTGEQLDRGLVVWFPGPASFTGEDSAELHLHGGPAVVAGVVQAALGSETPIHAMPECGNGPRGKRGRYERRGAGCNVSSSQPACRLALPGEFTRRAFENGRLDLTAAEALADLVRAETAAQRRQAITGVGGAAGACLTGWRDRLTRARALLEATIDFADEDLPSTLTDQASTSIVAVRREITEELVRGEAGIRLREGLLVAIVGPPNVGKSSLLNALAGREAAIVSSIPGTTRDIVEVSLDLGGYPVTLADTAGLREAADEIEAEGIRRARGLAARADLTVLVLDRQPGPDPLPEHRLIDSDADLIVRNKADLAPTGLSSAEQSDRVLEVSAKTGYGVNRLRQRLQAACVARLAGGEAAVVTRARHRTALLAAVSALESWEPTLEPEVQAHLLLLADRGIAAVLGAADVERVLDLIFSEFCIGK